MKKLIVFLVLLSSAFITLSPAPQATHATAALPPIAGLEAAYSQTIGDDDVQYHSVRHADGYQAENPAQGYTTTFGAEGITVSTEAWSWSMQIQGYDTTLPIAEANTTTYERDGLTEWYINGPVGLEQGFTLHEPAGRIATLELALLGDLTPTLVDEQTMILQTASGVTALHYHGLVAYDATHRQLPAWLALDGALQIHVDTSGAVYPVTIDPWIETQKLTASDAGDYHHFGDSVAIDGTTAIIGAPQHSLHGAAYIFTESGGVWTEQARLTASDAEFFDHFGFAVAIDGTTAIVGAHFENGGGHLLGAAYIFTESGGVWTEQTKLTALDAENTDQFGYSVSIDGATAIVGAVAKACPGFVHCGAAYIFTESGGVWTQQAKLTLADAALYDFFGVSVAIEGTTVIVGASGKNGASLSQGAAYIFTESGGVWMQQATLIPSYTEDYAWFGQWVAISGTMVVAGAPGENGIGTNQGAAYIFAEIGGVWTQQSRLVASNPGGNDYFGNVVAIDGTTVVVGANNYDSHGAAYIFTESGGVWTEQALIASDAQNGDQFGSAVAIEGATAIIGAIREDGVGAERGAAYVFWLPQPLAATASCDAATGNLVVDITAGDGPFDITGTGPGLPLLNVSAGTYTLTGPGTWTGVTVTETAGDLEGLLLGDFDCAAPTTLEPTAACDTATGNLVMDITAGDAPFNITGTGPGLPLNGIGVGTQTLTGPDTWTDVTVTETAGDLETVLLGDFTCEAPEPEPPPSPPPTIIDPALSKIGILQPGQLGLPGEQITWTITATAPSNADLNNVVISDTFRDELQIDGVTTTAGTVIINGQTVTVTIPVMAAGSSVTIQVTTTVLSSPVDGIFENTVTLTADGGVFLTTTATVSVVTGLPDTGYPPGEALHTE